MKLLLLKKTGVISVLAILFYTQIGYYGQFVVQQWLLKEEAREAWIASLPDRSFFRIRLADVNADGHWEEEGKECWYRNHLYDVIHRKAESGEIWLYCMDDEREAKLIRQSAAFTQTSNDPPDKNANRSFSFRMGEWLAEIVSLSVARPLVAVRRYCGCQPQALCLGYTEIVVPPPKLRFL